MQTIVVRWDLEGYHRWPDPPARYALLGSDHGHMFHFEVAIPVSGSRQLEFGEVRRLLQQAVLDRFGPEPCNFGSRSCEDLVEFVRWLTGNLVHEPVRVAVYEDRFVGAEWYK